MEFDVLIRTSQETVVEAVKAWVDTVKAVTPKVPSIQGPLAEKLPGSPGVRGCRLLYVPSLREAAYSAPGSRRVARRGEQQQPHDAIRPAGMTMSRFWILPVPPLGSESTNHTWRGYL